MAEDYFQCSPEESPYYGRDPKTLSAYEKIVHNCYLNGKVFKLTSEGRERISRLFENLEIKLENYKKENQIRQHQSERELSEIVLNK